MLLAVNSDIASTSVISEVQPLNPLGTEPISITQMRLWTLPKATSPKIGVIELKTLVKGLTDAGPNTRYELETSLKIPTLELQETIAAFGSWLGQSRGPADVEIVSFFEAEQGQQDLFPSHTKNKDGSYKIIVLPAGFDRYLGRRDLGRAIANIIVHATDEATIRRFILRRDHVVPLALSFGQIAAVQAIASVGRINDLAKVPIQHDGAQLPLLANVLVGAWDFLETHRASAEAAIDRLCAASAANELDLDAIATNISKASWVHEAQFSILTRKLRACIDSNGMNAGLRSELSLLARRVAVNRAAWIPADIKDMSQGQVLRLAQCKGFSTSSDGSEEATIRNDIVSAGLKGDLDQCFPLGVQAFNVGLYAAFKTALELRAAGDLDWSKKLRAKIIAKNQTSICS